ncbi:hypothetical protein [Bacterioplanoides sp.]|uniref:hypothetical protein n=1 Tax=Bacterioplanoides sp. TaxID=2066072 RepID=UPI003B5C511A
MFKRIFFFPFLLARFTANAEQLNSDYWLELKGFPGYQSFFSIYSNKESRGWQATYRKYEINPLGSQAFTEDREGNEFDPAMTGFSASYHLQYSGRYGWFRPYLGVGYFSGTWRFDCKNIKVQGSRTNTDRCDRKDLDDPGIVVGIDVILGSHRRAGIGLYLDSFYTAGEFQSHVGIAFPFNATGVLGAIAR